MTKFCKKCNTEKTIDCFSFDPKSPTGRSYYCKTCAAKVSRETYKIRMMNPDYAAKNRAKSRQHVRDIKEQAVIYMGSKCFDCGVSYPNFIYDFHHLDPSLKDMNPSKAFRKDFEQTKIELDKCVMLCANCHRRRHFQEGFNE